MKTEILEYLLTTSQIRNHITFDDWHYVPTEGNITDFTTRYQEFPWLLNNKNWFYGPHFLQAFEFNIFDKCSVLPKQINEYQRCKHYYEIKI